MELVLLYESKMTFKQEGRIGSVQLHEENA